MRGRCVNVDVGNYRCDPKSSTNKMSDGRYAEATNHVVHIALPTQHKRATIASLDVKENLASGGGVMSAVEETVHGDNGMKWGQSNLMAFTSTMVNPSSKNKKCEPSEDEYDDEEGGMGDKNPNMISKSI